ncbi:MAG: hypothetical protein ACOCU7_00870 [Tangfeifania sp.]
MSFRIFSLQLLGKIKPVEKIEIQRDLLQKDYEEFNRVAESDELKEFLELEKYIQSGEFKKRKAEIRGLHFKDSKEYNQLKEYEKLKNSKPFKKFFKLRDSAEFKRYQSLKDSELISEYRTLLDFIEKGNYKKQKDEIKRETFRGSSEEKKLAEFNKLKKSPGIKAYLDLHNSETLKKHNDFYESEKLKRYFELKDAPKTDKLLKKEFAELKKDPEIKSYLKFEHSKKLKLYHETVDSYNLKRYNELKETIESEEFKKRVDYLKDKKKFEKTDAFRKWKRFKELASRDDVKFFLKFEKSSLLRNYYDVKDSMEYRRFLELKEIVSSVDFKTRKEYLEDEKKWEKTDDYSKEQHYLEMKKLPHLVKYFKYKDTNAFSFFREWEVSFEDNFTENTPDKEKWSTKSLWAENLPGGNHSMPGDLHTFTDGRNIKINDKLIIETRRESAEGMIWKMPAGFVPARFDFTTGILSNNKSFKQKDGIFEAKIKFNPIKEVVSSAMLQGEFVSPRIMLLEMGTKNRLGVAHSMNAGKMKVDGLDISNLHKNKWYIFTLEKNGSALTWKINETEVLKLENQKIDFNLHLDLFSLVVFEIPGSKLPVQFETDWVRCYRRK